MVAKLAVVVTALLAREEGIVLQNLSALAAVAVIAAAVLLAAKVVCARDEIGVILVLRMRYIHTVDIDVRDSATRV